ncbi:branched-chain amino acid transport system ATP-binding protein [Rhizobium aquaticum]|uniref:Branched-chain amino acid transport system ATP-binding protein n=1 Tax=Rhizobium aquaticum TaxID=1549636 RepID=A0ABV2J673_9HYPH
MDKATGYRIEQCSAWYGQARVLWDIDFHVGPGEVVGVLGRNGAGKTTLLKSIAGVLRKQTGHATLNGRDIGSQSSWQISRAGISLVREGAILPKSLSVAEVIALGARLAGIRGREPVSMATILERFPLLSGLEDRKVALLSGGQRQAVALASGLASRPDMLLLDEPSAGLAPTVAASVFRAISTFAADGVMVVVVEQHEAWLRGLAERTYWIDLGRVAASKTNRSDSEQQGGRNEIAS